MSLLSGVCNRLSLYGSASSRMMVVRVVVTFVAALDRSTVSSRSVESSASSNSVLSSSSSLSCGVLCGAASSRTGVMTATTGAIGGSRVCASWSADAGASPESGFHAARLAASITVLSSPLMWRHVQLMPCRAAANR